MNSSASSPPSRLARSLTSRRGAWWWLSLGLVVLIGLFGVFGSAKAPGGNAQAPVDAESTRAAEVMKTFPGADRSSLMIVTSRTDGAKLTAADQTWLDELAPTLPEVMAQPAPTILSEDGKAALTQISVPATEDSARRVELVSGVRDAVHEATPAGVTTQVTGGPAFGADITGAFAGANITLLLVTIGIVALLLIVTYRSPVLWLLPLTVVALADGLAGRVTAALGTALDLQFDAGIISVLVFGAGANYALLLVSRYREELRVHEDRRLALATAWQRTLGAIVGSNVTVILSLLTLSLAVIPGTRGLGVSGAAGLIVAVLAVLFLLTPLLAVCGRGIFWPFVPRPGQGAETGRVWGKIARGVTGRPTASLLSGLAVLAILASGLFGTSLGLTQIEQFRVPSESAAGLETLGEHFPAGEAQPTFVITKTADADAVTSAVTDVDGVTRAMPIGTTDDGELTKIMVTGDTDPGSEASFTMVQTIRDEAHAVDSTALVGGDIATELDARAGNMHDLWLIAPLILAISLIVLILLLRSLIAPILLLLVNVASAAAAIGAGAFLSRIVFGLDALDLQVPLLAFLFLVALGIDYTIFLAHRTRAESALRGTRAGVTRAVAATGGVITSAGIVLAGVFAALGVLPLVTLGQLGIIVGLGVLVDTLLVRTVIVPAVFALVGDRIWWPGRLRPAATPPAAVDEHATPRTEPVPTT